MPVGVLEQGDSPQVLSPLTGIRAVMVSLVVERHPILKQLKVGHGDETPVPS